MRLRFMSQNEYIDVLLRCRRQSPRLQKWTVVHCHLFTSFFQSTSWRVCAVSGSDHFYGYYECHFCSFRGIVWRVSLPPFHTHTNQRTNEPTNQPTNPPTHPPTNQPTNQPSLHPLSLPPTHTDTETQRHRARETSTARTARTRTHTHSALFSPSLHHHPPPSTRLRHYGASVPAQAALRDPPVHCIQRTERCSQRPTWISGELLSTIFLFKLDKKHTANVDLNGGGHGQIERVSGNRDMRNQMSRLASSEVNNNSSCTGMP